MSIQKKDMGTIGLPVNEQIRAPRIQVIGSDGESLGILSREEALRAAQSASLDLVVVVEQGKDGLPVAKIVDYGKVLYAKKKKIAEAKKHQKVIQVKEIKIRPKIAEHDYQTKIRQMFEFLREDKHVKITVVFKGREGAFLKEKGTELFEKLEKTLRDFGMENAAFEKESRAGMLWSRIYFVKK